VSASYDPATKKLTLTALENDLSMDDGYYWVSVTERGRDESRRLRLGVKFLYPLALTYDANGGVFTNGAAVSEHQMANSGAGIPSPASNPSRDGFVFAGWNEKTDGSGGAFPGDAALTGDVYVFAKWIGEGTPYTVTFHANGGSFSGGAETLEKTGTFTAGGSGLGAAHMPSTPASPDSTKYTFTGWNTRADGLGAVFTGTTLINSPAVTVYAKWHWNRDADGALKLHHDFASGRISGTAVTPKVAPSDGDAYTATMTGTGGASGAKNINGTNYYYYKTGPRLVMSNSAVSYLNLGTGAGTVLKNAGNGYTAAAYIRIDSDADRSGNGSFTWVFGGGTNNPSNGVYFITNSGRIDHVTKVSGSEKTFALAAADRGKIANGTWLHVAYTQDSSNNARLYINGAEALKGTIDTLPAAFSGDLSFNTLGGPCFTGDYNLSKTMFADFRIYDEALEEIQIRELASDLNVLNSVTWP
jgi:hypothetical protein